ncbi:hypothetical protein RRG08_056626 [Elysia crispata]|uniref:Carboxylesterase type B domain-containing protein n=1 Tax=Elysia crispata TaxID=231223 RepID=A0AAE1B204_9GAST|nr:hypothetical protein RRG08_056626 [Elysia crispata]
MSAFGAVCVAVLHLEESSTDSSSQSLSQPSCSQGICAAPEPATPWGGVRDALELSPACPQPQDGVTYIQSHVPHFNRTSEDCLYLNVYAPRNQQNLKPRLNSSRSHGHTADIKGLQVVFIKRTRSWRHAVSSLTKLVKTKLPRPWKVTSERAV